MYICLNSVFNRTFLYIFLSYESGSFFLIVKSGSFMGKWPFYWLAKPQTIVVFIVVCCVGCVVWIYWRFWVTIVLVVCFFVNGRFRGWWLVLQAGQIRNMFPLLQPNQLAAEEFVLSFITLLIRVGGKQKRRKVIVFFFISFVLVDPISTIDCIFSLTYKDKKKKQKLGFLVLFGAV